MSKRIATRKPTGAELRQMRDQRRTGGPEIEAARRAQSIRDALNSFANSIDAMADAYNREDWKTLGYKNWQEYCAGEFSPERVRLSIEQRKQWAASLASAGLTKRAAAAALGVSHTTIQNDASGKKLPLPAGEPQVKTDAEVAEEVAQATASFDEKYSGDVTTADGVSGQDGGSAGDHTQTAREPLAGDGLDGPVAGNPCEKCGTEVEQERASAGYKQCETCDPQRAHWGSTLTGEPCRTCSSPAGSDGHLDTSHWSQSQPGSGSPLARGGDAPEETTLPGSSGAPNLTEGSAPTPPAEPVLSPAAVPGVAVAGGGAEEEAGGEAASSSADPAAGWMAAWRYAIANIHGVSGHLSDAERGEVRDDLITVRWLLFGET